MKPSLYDYVVPDRIEDAVAARAAYDDSVVLSGGQSLIPTLNFRLSNPDVVVDLRRIPGLDRVTVEPGWIDVGGMTRQRDLELDDTVFAANPLIRETLRHVAHPVIRNRGTIGGSIAHADPAAELPCLLMALDGHVTVHGEAETRTVAAADLFEFILTTSLEPDEVLTGVRFPALGPGTGWCFTEFARRHGDFALAGTAVTVTVEDGLVTAARLAACGVSSTPVRLREVEDAVVGTTGDSTACRDAARHAEGAVTVRDDPSASAGYRRHLLAGLVQRALERAVTRATGRVPAIRSQR